MATSDAMRYLVWLELDGFYTSIFDDEAPLVISRERRVLDANLPARARGVAMGMGIRQAKALVEGLVVRPWQEDRYAERRNEWLDACTEFTGIIEPEDQHAASFDLSGHPDPLDVAERLVRSLAQLGMGQVRYGIAPTKWVARMATGRTDGEWAISDPPAFLAPISVLELLPIPREHRERLHFLGYREIGDLTQIPLEVLQGQFGGEGMRIRQAALGALFEPVLAKYPEGSLVDSLIFDGGVDSREAIDEALRTIARRVGQRLGGMARQSAKVAITFEDEEGRRTRRERRFTKPVRCPATALAAFRLLSVGLDMPAVASIRVQLEDLEIVRRTQGSLAGFLPEGERRPGADSALKYIRTVYGDRAVRRASEVEVPRRVQVLREWKNATGWR